MQDSVTTWALVPIKDFARAKSRLAAALSPEQCSELARSMAADVVTALRDCPDIGHVVCLGQEPCIRDFAAEYGCEFIAERAGTGLSASLDQAARQLEKKGARKLLVVPGDLPVITPDDLVSLLDKHRDGLTICPAGRDGGTNAIIISPPTGIHFRFGKQSCERHIRAAEAAGLEHRNVNATAFRYDIDVPADLAWLCSVEPDGHTGRFLNRSSIPATFCQPPSSATA